MQTPVYQQAEALHLRQRKMNQHRQRRAKRATFDHGLVPLINEIQVDESQSTRSTARTGPESDVLPSSSDRQQASRAHCWVRANMQYARVRLVL
jgi:hypothetical protein